MQQGGALVLQSGSLASGIVAGGAGGTPAAQNGSGLGPTLFLQGTQPATLAPTAGTTLSIAGGIADQRSNGGAGTLTAGAGTLTGASSTSALSEKGFLTAMDGLTRQLVNGIAFHS